MCALIAQAVVGDHGGRRDPQGHVHGRVDGDRWSLSTLNHSPNRSMDDTTGSA
jgi:hypothetical protein